MAFYRPLECAPRRFNLLNPYDDDIAPDCGLFVEGSALVEGGNPAPIQLELQNVPGESVPIGFTEGTEWLAAAADGELTDRELTGWDCSLIGWAAFSQETLHPADPADPNGESRRTARASGVLEDGRPFDLQVCPPMGRTRSP